MLERSSGGISSFAGRACEIRQPGEILLPAFRQHIAVTLDADPQRIDPLVVVFGFAAEVIRERPDLAVDLFGEGPEQGFEGCSLGPAALDQRADPKIKPIA